MKDAPKAAEATTMPLFMDVHDTRPAGTTAQEVDRIYEVIEGE